MKSVITLFMFFVIYSVSAQDCGEITAGYQFVHDDLRFSILNGHQFFNGLGVKVGIGPNGDIDTREYSPLVQSTNIWAGGFDPNGSLKLAATNDDDSDWVMGPLDEYGQTNAEICEYWDKIFTVSKEEIIIARKVYDEGGPCEDIATSILNWPGKRNPNLNLPTGYRGAEFYDENGDGIYDPCAGDFPMVNLPTHYFFHYKEYIYAMPSEISYYVMNDNGKAHFPASGSALQIEIGVYIFSYVMQDVEDVIFMKYEIENKGTDDVRDLFVGNWIDFEIGCEENDHVGTDSNRKMVYAYNSDQEDGCSISNTITQKSQIGLSYQGVDFDPYLIEIIDGEIVLKPIPVGSGAWPDTLVLRSINSSIIPYNCPNDDFCDFEDDVEYYNVLKGLTKDGSSILDNNDNVTKMMFTGDPSDPNGWSLCTEDAKAETTSVSAMGHFTLQSREKTTMLQAFIHTGSFADSCSSSQSLQLKQKKVEEFFHRGFYHQVGPPPPRLTIQESDQGLLLKISELPLEYKEPVQTGVKFFSEKYRFEGIKIYQVRSGNFDLGELDNINFSRLIYQGDIENGVDELYNWEEIANPDPSQPPFWVPERKVNGADSGIMKEVLFDRDYFSDSYESPVPGKEYFFLALSYGYNNYKQFDPYDEPEDFGQKYPYVESTFGINVISTNSILSNQNKELDSLFRFQTFGQNWIIDKTKSELMVDMLSINGGNVKSWNLKKGDVIDSRDYENLPSGIYFINIRDSLGYANASYKVIYF